MKNHENRLRDGILNNLHFYIMFTECLHDTLLCFLLYQNITTNVNIIKYNDTGHLVLSCLNFFEFKTNSSKQSKCNHALACSNLSMPIFILFKDSSLPSKSNSSIAPPGVYCFPDRAVRMGHNTWPFLTPSCCISSINTR